jgi:hypothetical protein
MKIEDRGLIMDGRERPASQRAVFQTGLYRAHSGSIFATFQVGPKKHAPTATLGMCRSRDGGRTWRALRWQFETTLEGVPGSLLAGELVESQPGTLLLLASWWDRSDPDRPILDPVTKGILHSRNLIVYTHDERALATDGKQQVDYVQYWEDMLKWSFGHPAIRSLGGGKVLVAWYAGTPDCLSLRWARVDVGE